MDHYYGLHAGTPHVVVGGTAGPVRAIHFLRTANQADNSAHLLISHTMNELSTRTRRQFGARALSGGIADVTTSSDMTGQTLCLTTADGDTSLMIRDAAGRSLWSCSAQGTVNVFIYESPAAGGRIKTISERPVGGVFRIREQFTYAPAGVEQRAKNLAGILSLHHDNAGFSEVLNQALSGHPLETQQHLLLWDADLPDWSSLPATEPPLTMSTRADTTGALLTQTNASGVTTVTAYDVSGALRENHLCYDQNGLVTKVVTLKNIVRSAEGLVLSQTSGNGVVEMYNYHPQSRRLTRHAVRRGARYLSDLRYSYDPAGNILSQTDVATVTRRHRNLTSSGERNYTYDTLYRLISATGRERLPDTLRGPHSRVRTDGTGGGGEWFPYRESYSYDHGDNLLKIVHAGNRPWTRELTVSATSNRALPKEHALTPESGFQPGGLQTQLADGRTLEWYADGQLHQVSPVVRAGEDSDTEVYHYRNGGARTRKISAVKVAGGAQTTVTTYAGGSEMRQRRLGKALQLDIVVTDGGGMRLIENRLTEERQLRYAFTDRQGSSGGETDAEGLITSRDEYYPYGGSAGSDEEAAKEIYDRTRRYSGKERDATGLIYYGWRYYQPEAGRWLSADPGGLIDGVNLFRFCHNKPSQLTDSHGLKGTDPSFDTLLELTKKIGNSAGQTADDIADEYHRMTSNAETRQKMSDQQALKQIKNLESILKHSHSLSIYPQGRKGMTPLQLYYKDVKSISARDGDVGYYRIMRKDAVPTKPQSRINIMVRKEYVDQLAQAIASITVNHIDDISQSKVTAYDKIGDVAESAVIYLTFNDKSRAKLIKKRFMDEFSKKLLKSNVNVQDALLEHPSVSMKRLDKGIHYKEISEKFVSAGQGSIAYGVAGIVEDAINLGRESSSPLKESLEKTLTSWGYSQKKPAILSPSSSISVWGRLKKLF